MSLYATAVKKPVTVKLRAGYDEAHKNVLEIALVFFH